MTKEEFSNALENNHIEKVRKAIKKDINTLSYNYNHALQVASEFGYIDIFKMLLNTPANPAYDNDFAIQISSENGHTEMVEILLNDPRVNPSNDHNCAIRWAYSNEQTHIVELLWKNEKIKNTLKNDNIDLYNKLVKQDIKNKVNKF
jgi:ankyrin repeat protein